MFAEYRSWYEPGYWRDIVAAGIHNLDDDENFFIAWSVNSTSLLFNEDITHFCEQERVVLKAMNTMHTFLLPVDTDGARQFLECYQMFSQANLYPNRWRPAIQMGFNVAKQLENNDRTNIVDNWNAFKLQYQRMSLFDKIEDERGLATEIKQKLKIVLLHADTRLNPNMVEQMFTAFKFTGRTEARRTGRMNRIQDCVNEWFATLGRYPIDHFTTLLAMDINTEA